MNHLQDYRVINANIAKEAEIKFRNHLWYLGADLAPLAFFSDQLTTKEKFAMQKSLSKEPKEAGRQLKLNPSTDFRRIHLHSLIDSSSLDTMKMLKLDLELLTGTHPSVWKKSLTYQRMKLKINALKVVNDTGERAIALISSVNGLLTKNESELQNVLQVIEQKREQMPNCDKSTIINMNQH